MAKLFIPACGDRITLTQPWQFTLYFESRNVVFAKSCDLIKPHHSTKYYYDFDSVPHTIPAGTILECDRVYIRANSKSAVSKEDNYDSITWKIVINNKASKTNRFWAKLTDCYSIEFDDNSISKYIDRK